MIRIRSIAWLLAAAAIASTAARADDEDYWHYPHNSRAKPWAVSLYVGPNSHKWAGAIVQDGFNTQSRGILLGLTLDRKLVRLFRDIYLVGEIQIGQTFMDNTDTIFSGMLGIQIDNLFGFERTSFSAYTGPSYDLNPANYVIGYKHRYYSPILRKKFLNAVAAEFASGLPWSENWDWAARLFHRSGVFGLYSDGDDDGMSFGLGLKYHF